MRQEIDPDYATEFAPYANSWRTSMDIDCYCEVLVKWPAVKRVFSQAAKWVPYAGNKRTTGRPDLDSLNLGNGQMPWGSSRLVCLPHTVQHTHAHARITALLARPTAAPSAARDTIHRHHCAVPCSCVPIVRSHHCSVL